MSYLPILLLFPVIAHQDQMKICITCFFDFLYHFYILLLTDIPSFSPNTKSKDDFSTFFYKSLLSGPYEFWGILCFLFSCLSLNIYLLKNSSMSFSKKTIVRLLINFGLETTHVRHLMQCSCIHTEIMWHHHFLFYLQRGCCQILTSLEVRDTDRSIFQDLEKVESLSDDMKRLIFWFSLRRAIIILQY